MPYVVGGNEVYQQQTSWPMVLEHSDVVVLWSANPLNTLKLPGTLPMADPMVRSVAQKRKRVICTIRCDRKRRNSFGEAGEWIAPHMGTDVAMMLGIAHTLVENGWQDEAFSPAVPAAMTFLPAI